MDLLQAIADHIGLGIFAVVSIVLMVYLAYSMVRPERF